jgi:hypothetical protein
MEDENMVVKQDFAQVHGIIALTMTWCCVEDVSTSLCGRHVDQESEANARRHLTIAPQKRFRPISKIPREVLQRSLEEFTEFLR